MFDFNLFIVGVVLSLLLFIMSDLREFTNFQSLESRLRNEISATEVIIQFFNNCMIFIHKIYTICAL